MLIQGVRQRAFLRPSLEGVRALLGPGTELHLTAAFFIAIKMQHQWQRTHRLYGDAAVCG